MQQLVRAVDRGYLKDLIVPVIRKKNYIYRTSPQTYTPWIDLIPGTKYCVTRQWPLPEEQCGFIDKFFRAKHATGMEHEIISPHSAPTFCVKNTNDKWRVIHAYNELIPSIISAQTTFLERMFFRTTWLVVPCTAHSTSPWLLLVQASIIHSQRLVHRAACAGSV